MSVKALELALVAVLIAACAERPRPLEPGDTAQTRGTLLARGDIAGDLVWIPGTDLVAFSGSMAF